MLNYVDWNNKWYTNILPTLLKHGCIHYLISNCEVWIIKHNIFLHGSNFIYKKYINHFYIDICDGHNI